ncbi:hypothetical protein B0J14DRAFT_59149 [Halenospora varia]|nr:hypothetical protein B0J14DRAFT_59149 [Halenospora varia]
MGCWGPYLFQSDNDYDVIDEFSDQAGVELYHFEDSNGSQLARDALDGGKFNELFTKLESDRGSWVDPPYKMVLLVTIAMIVGAKVPMGKRRLAIRLYKRCGFMEGAKDQLKEALSGYQDGEPWNFDQNLGLLDSMSLMIAENAENDEAAKKSGDGQGKDSKSSESAATVDGADQTGHSAGKDNIQNLA